MNARDYGKLSWIIDKQIYKYYKQPPKCGLCCNSSVVADLRDKMVSIFCTYWEQGEVLYILRIMCNHCKIGA